MVVLCVVMIGVLIGAIVPLLAILVGGFKVVKFFVFVDIVGTTEEIKRKCFLILTIAQESMTNSYDMFYIGINSMKSCRLFEIKLFRTKNCFRAMFVNHCFKNVWYFFIMRISLPVVRLVEVDTE